MRLLTVSPGIGDLIVTCSSRHSRNRKAGYLIGQGRTMQEAMDEVQMVVEGVYSARAARILAEKYGIDMPIVNEVNKVLFENKTAREAMAGSDASGQEDRTSRTSMEKVMKKI